MKLQPVLVNPEYQDPILMVSIPQKSGLILFDLGYCFRLKLRDIKRISRIFITHTHIDHFAGFDHVLRLSIDQEKNIEVYGPPGIIRNVGGKLAGYVWNLAEGVHVNFLVHEVRPDGIFFKEFQGQRGFENDNPPEKLPPAEDGSLCITEDYRVHAIFLEHRMPVLAYRMSAVPSYNADINAIRELGLEPGKWVGNLKEIAMLGNPPNAMVEVDGEKRPAAPLVEKVIHQTPGSSLVYVVDTIYNDKTAPALTAFAVGADYLFSESAYLSTEEHLARENHHLTATQAATIARDAGVKKLILFHFSRRYEAEYGRFYDEARTIFPDVEKAVKYAE